MASALRPLLVVAGLGTGGGTGAAAARLFAKNGYSVALIARGAGELTKLSDEINASGGTAASFPIESYSAPNVAGVFTKIRSHFKGNAELRVAVYNAGHGVWKPFLEITPEDVAAITQTNIEASFAFAREVLLDFQKNEIHEQSGKRGALIFTGATAAVRGNVITSAFSAGKHAMRALSQSLAKEFGKQNIHVSHAIIDGLIYTNLNREKRPEWEKDEAARLSPDSIAASYLYLAQQDRSAWTWELDLRPAHEKW
ncbi:hypothetical protein C8J56DRAFT_936501 [Mycena floridula]|nr:hypothetical protein C8J56DRAFT_936501 [Mycena floridula]